jgi:hypothetical protein
MHFFTTITDIRQYFPTARSDDLLYKIGSFDTLLQINGIFVIAQMKSHLILVKTIKDTFATSDYLTIQFGPQILKMTKNHDIGPISNIDSVKSMKLRA